LPTADCFPITAAPGLSRLFLDFCAGADSTRAFYGQPDGNGLSDRGWQRRPPLPAHWDQVVSVLAEQNGAPAAQTSLEVLRRGGGTVLTGQQVGLFGGPLFTPFKAATALARAREASAEGRPHAAIFWLATEDHDFAEVNHVSFPARREIRKLIYTSAPANAQPVGGVVLDSSIDALVEQAWELLGSSDAMDALAESYKPGRTLAQAFGDFYRKVFAAQGLLILDAAGRTMHRVGSPVLGTAIERADEFHARLVERSRALEAAGYHAQVAVVDGGAGASSLLFLIHRESGARVALKRQAASAAEPDGLWQAGREKFTTADLLGILKSEPERISPSALLRPVFQDFLLSTSLTIGGPAEVAYFAQSAVLFEQILGRMTPVQPRLSATLIEPAIDELLRKHELSLDRVFVGNEESLTQLLAARAMPIESKRKLAATGTALDAELSGFLQYMHALDEGLGRSAETAASKMRYQMNRLRRLAANFELQKEGSLGRHAQAIMRALFPARTLQERAHGAAYYFARSGFDLAEELVRQALDACPGHRVIRL
jgi:bacillithiol biosynthesis cysteine-adding enzyme BshC